MQAVARARTGRHVALSAYWFGNAFHWFLLLPLIMPGDVQRLVGEADKATALGILQGGLALIPLVLPPYLGVWSDRLGRRLPFLGLGTLVNVLGLAVMFVAPSYWVYALGYLLVQLGNSVASGPYAALIPDLVPEGERGAASGVMGFLQLLGQIGGGLAAFALGASNRGGQYAAIAVVLSLSALVTVLTTQEPTRRRATTAHIPWRVFLEPQYRDFRWVFLTRAFTEFGRFSVQPFLLYYLADVIGRYAIGGLVLPGAEDALTVMLVALSLTAAATALLGGRLSDRVGKKPVIYAAGTVMALAALGFAATSAFPVAFGMALLFGLGYGAFVSVDWALGTAVLPNAATYARDMGVWHVAMVFPQLFQGVGGRVLDAGNALSKNAGYPILFAVAIAFFVLRTVFVSRVRGVR